ncbi:MAG: DegT/DnrJ/EryC1/StrS family aminotransferase [Magnetococcales bacterium]|nr:DegT/DnrJ/EryC1/StrS family aminotransferase [Magnetococcales bacterium]
MSESEVIPRWWIEVGEAEIARIAEAIRGRHISMGPVTAAFEEAIGHYLGVAHVVCVPSGSMALTMALMAAGVGPGDEVLVPDRTWIATATAPRLLGARVVLVDVRADGLVIDESQVEERITARTRAILPVHVNGTPAALGPLLEIAKRHGVTLIEDACQAFSSRYQGRCLGTFGRFGCFSLGLNKLLTTGQGGFVVCHDADDARLLRRIRNQGLSGADLSECHQISGSNFKFTDIQAAMGLAQMERLPARVEHQRAVYRAYAAGLADIPWLELTRVDLDAGQVPLRTEYVCLHREALIEALRRHDIIAEPQAPCLHQYGFLASDRTFPHAERYCSTLLMLPSGPEQPLAHVQRTINVIRQVAPEIERMVGSGARGIMSSPTTVRA